MFGISFIEIIFNLIIFVFLIYALVEIDHWFPVRDLLFIKKKFVDYSIYDIEPKLYIFYYKDNNGKRYVEAEIDLVSRHSDGKVYLRGQDVNDLQYYRFDTKYMSRVYLKNNYMRVWYPKEFFKKQSRYGALMKEGRMERD